MSSLTVRPFGADAIVAAGSNIPTLSTNSNGALTAVGNAQIDAMDPRATQLPYQQDQMRRVDRTFWQVMQNEGLIVVEVAAAATAIAGVAASGGAALIGIAVAVLVVAAVAHWYFHKQAQHWQDISKSLAVIKQQAAVMRLQNDEFGRQNGVLKLSNDEYQQLNLRNRALYDDQVRLIASLSETSDNFSREVAKLSAIIATEKEMLITEWEEVMGARAVMLDEAQELDAAEDTFTKQARQLTGMLANLQELSGALTQLVLPGNTAADHALIIADLKMVSEKLGGLRSTTLPLEQFMAAHQALFDGAIARTEASDRSTEARANWTSPRALLAAMRAVHVEKEASFEEKRAQLRAALGMDARPFPESPVIPGAPRVPALPALLPPPPARSTEHTLVTIPLLNTRAVDEHSPLLPEDA